MIFLNGVVPENVKRMLNEGRGDELENILLNGGSGGSGGGVNTENLTVVFPITDITVPDNTDGMVPIMQPLGTEAGNIYLIVWNNVGYICEAQEAEFQGAPVIAIGNLAALGGENTGEPFAIGEFPPEVAAQMGGTYGGIIPLDGSTSFTAGGYFIGKNSNETILEDLPVVLDFSDGDQNLTAPEGSLVKSAIIEKPENLKPEYILEGINIAGIIGTLVQGGGASGGIRVGRTSASSKPYIPASTAFSAEGTWSATTWSGITSTDMLMGLYLWTDGSDMYLNANKMLEKETATWKTKTWAQGPSSVFNNYIWTDGTDIYYSFGSSQFVLDKATSTWSAKTWSGVSNMNGNRIWTDGTDIYYSDGNKHYLLDKTTSTWSTVTWSGLSSFYGEYIWTDGTDIYYSNGSSYVLDKATSTWSAKTWGGASSLNGNQIWTDGENIYCSNTSTYQYRLNQETDTWTNVSWNGISDPGGNYFWTDGANLYCSFDNTKQYVLST